MYKITDEHFTNYFEKAFRNLDEVHEEHLNLETLRQKNSISKKLFEKLNITTNKTQKFMNIFFNHENIYESFLKLSDEKNIVINKNIFFDKNLEDLEDLRDFDIKNYMVDDILTKIDRSSMFYSVEARSPFLDKDIYDYVKNTSLNSNIDIFSKKNYVRVVSVFALQIILP